MRYTPTQPTVKRNEVRQLLKDYAPWHFAGGAAAELNLESRGGYGPSGGQMAGAQFDKEHRAWYRHYMDALEKALTLLRFEDPDALAVLRRPYLTDPADADLVRMMEERAAPALRRVRNRKAPDPPQAAWHALEWVDLHERAVDKLAGYLVNVETEHVVFPKSRTSKFAEDVETRSNEFYDLKCRLEAEGLKRGQAIQKAADQCGIVRSRAYVIVETREKPLEITLAD